MTSFPWQQATQSLLEISQHEIRLFLESERSRNVYGIGYFCHNSWGDVLLVANTTDYHEDSFREYVEKFGACDEDEYKWDIGNWRFPGGVDVGPAGQSDEYQAGWKPFRATIEQLTASGAADHPGTRLREFCCEVLRCLIRSGIFDTRFPDLGFTVMDVDDATERGVQMKRAFDQFIGNRLTRL